MYLRTLYELAEEGVLPRRARLAERLGQSFPTVSQTVARMVRDGLVALGPDREVELTQTGRELAGRVMRKHRLAERLLVDLIGLDWDLVHDEACRWEHVMSEAVERRLLVVLGHPEESPYGNPIPLLEELGDPAAEEHPEGVTALTAIRGTAMVVVRRIGEAAQADAELMSRLRAAGVRPGAAVRVTRGPGGVRVGAAGKETTIGDDVAAQVLVGPAPLGEGQGSAATRSATDLREPV
jgi:DtxR family Mn-dependent transcriptional regulator